MKVFAFSTSNSKASINKAIVTHLAKSFAEAEIKVASVSDYNLPIYGPDLEREQGILQPAKNFYNDIAAADLIIIGFAEHNGNFTAAYKNLLDWTSRIDMSLFQNKPSIFVAATPGMGGAQSVLSIAQSSAKFFKNEIKSVTSVPNCYEAFDIESSTCISEELKNQIERTVEYLSASA